MSRRAASPGSPGFTLVEALLATLLMGVIMAALATVTAQWLPNWDKGVARLQRIEALATGLDRIVADIAAAEIVSAGGPKDPPIFDGTSLSVSFVRTALGPNAVTGLEIVRIGETNDERGPALVRSAAVFAPNAGDDPRTGARLFSNPVVVVRGPYRVAFSYAGPDRVWQDTWRAQPDLPRAVRVRLRDLATMTTLAVSTSTLIYADLPVRCIWAKVVADCPALVGLGSAGGEEGAAGGGGPGNR